jgi:protein SCO1/2
MKPKIVFALICAFTLAAALSAFILGHRNSSSARSTALVQTFEVKGQVRGIDQVEKTIRIAHEEIPNYMPAMTMSLPVKDATLLRDLRSGDSVQFELLVTSDDSWIARIEKVPSDATATQTVAKATPSLGELETERIHTGEVVPDFKLTNQDGRPIHLSDFRGKAVVLTFIYTRCPLPNFCPLISKNFAELQQRLSKEFPNKYQLLTITMDPEFDRPEVLKEYAARYEANPRDWTFATGDTATINFVAGLLGLYFERENGLISHDLRTALIGQDGRLVHLWKSNVWTPYEVQRRVRENLTGSEDIASK